MRISDLYKNAKRPVVSFEVFPPKKNSGKDGGIGAITSVLGDLARLRPDFISVTCGAGGVDCESEKSDLSLPTRIIAAALKRDYKTEPLAHLTCAASDAGTVRAAISDLRAEGVINVLALRGDRGDGSEPDSPISDSFRYASELVAELCVSGDFCVGAACYPEGHIECGRLSEDTRCLREKQDAGASFLITQLFFDNEVFFRFLDRAAAAGIKIPISAGVMPILSAKQIERMIFMCGASLPSDIIKLLYKYRRCAADLRKAGIERAVSQMESLARGGAAGIHVYTMNHPDIAASAMSRLQPGNG